MDFAEGADESFAWVREQFFKTDISKYFVFLFLKSFFQNVLFFL